MAVQWLGNIKPTGRGNLARDIGDAVQPAVSAYSDYLAKTSEREKTQVNEFITRAKALSVKEREAMMVELRGKPEFMKTVEEYAPGVLGEGNTLNLPVNYEVVGTLGTKVILRDGTTTKVVDMGKDADFDNYDVIKMADGSLMKENTRTGERTDAGEVREIFSTSENTITLDDGSSRVITKIIYTNGDITKDIGDAGINADFVLQQNNIDANKYLAKLNIAHEDKWNEKEFTQEAEQFSASMAFEMSEVKRSQENIERKEKSAQAKFDTQMKEDTRQFSVNNALAMYREKQTNKRFDAELEQRADQYLKDHNIDVKYKDALIQNMTDKMNLAHDNYDLSNTIANRKYITTNIELDQRQQQLDIALKESEWGIKAIKAKMNQYVSISAVFAEDGKTIIGASGLVWDPETEEYVTERLKNVPSEVAVLMVKQQILELEGNEQDNIIKAQGYSGLAAGVYGTVRNAKIPSMDSAEAWSSTAYMYAEKYAEGNEDVTAESAYGRILAHAYNRGWIDEDLIPNESLLYTDEANTAFNKEQETWAKENPKTTKVEDTTPSTNPNLMSGGLQTMTPEDNQFKSLLNTLLGNDTLYNNLKSAVTLPEQASNMTLGQALSDMNFSGPISRLEELAPGVLGGAGRRSAEYTKDIKNPTWEKLIQLLGLGGGSE